MTEGLAFATKMLREYGEFYPFGVIKTATGEIKHIGAKGESENPPSGELIALLRESYYQQAQGGNYAATALFYDVRIAPPGEKIKADAVQVELEHHGGYCANVFFPYSWNAIDDVVFGEIFATKREPTVFWDTP